MARSSATPLAVTRVVEWYCPNCGRRDQTKVPAVEVGGGAARMHQCPKVGMILAPMLPEGVKAKVVAVEREDYVGDEDVRLNDQGRPIMSIVTTRDNGQDAIVFAPTAHLRAR